MTPGQFRTLKDHVASTPNLQALAGSGDDTGLATALNADHQDGPAKGSRLTALGLYDVLGPQMAAPLLYALKVVAATDPPTETSILLGDMYRILWMVGAGGLDFGDPRTQGQMDALAEAQALDADAVAALKAYGTRKWSLAETVCGVAGVTVSVDDAAAIRRALA